MTALEMEQIQLKMQSYLEQLNLLLNHLNEEYEALKSRDITALDECLKLKEKTITDLESFENENKSCLKQANKEGASDELSFFRKKIKNVIDKCNKQNQVNGALIDISNQFNQRMIDIMLGKEKEADIYDTQGKGEAAYSSNSVVRV
jgi:flagellar biosynthesis/type III secretory pathway chaperone